MKMGHFGGPNPIEPNFSPTYFLNLGFPNIPDWISASIGIKKARKQHLLSRFLHESNPSNPRFPFCENKSHPQKATPITFWSG